MNKVICGGFNVGRGLRANGKVLELLNRIPPITDEDEGKVLGTKDGELAFIRIPLTFIAAEAGSTVKFTKNIGDSSKPIPLDINLEYSTDDGATWTNWNYDTPVTLTNVGDKILVCGDNPEGLGYSVGTTDVDPSKNHNKFVMTGKIKCFGDLLSLISKDMSVTDISNTFYCFSELFRDCGSMLIAPTLGAQKLGEYCYNSLFRNCTSLVTPPTLLSMELAKGCYCQMFIACANLKSAPAILPALELKDECYKNMFNGCSSLITTPELPALHIPYRAYYGMFYQCTSLTKFNHALPALSLSEQCYGYMFRESGLTTIPDLPATELAKNCYWYMFARCQSLTDLSDKVLPATSPVEACYANMFFSCNNLVTPPEVMLTSLVKKCLYSFCGGNSTSGATQITSIKVHFTEWDTVNTGSDNATYGWIHNRQDIPNGKFYCPASLPEVRDNGHHIPSSWEKVDI